jgi:hypothetical protein
MPIFGRRQLQRMLNELGPWLDRGKAKDLLNRLENEKPNQALPAEYELSISWAVSKIATLEIDRPAGSRTPDIYSPDLLPSGPFIADVAAVDDLTLSGPIRCDGRATSSTRKQTVCWNAVRNTCIIRFEKRVVTSVPEVARVLSIAAAWSGATSSSMRPYAQP